MSNVSTPSAAKYVLIAFWGVFSDWLAEEEATRAWFMDGFARYAGTIQKQTAAALKPPSAATLKDTGNGNSPQVGRASGSAHGITVCWEGEMSRRIIVR